MYLLSRNANFVNNIFRGVPISQMKVKPVICKERHQAVLP